MEATGYSRWFERLLAELGFEVWMGDPAEITAKRVKKQKFDREDAQLLLRLMRENNFPQVWLPGPENRDLRQEDTKDAEEGSQGGANSADYPACGALKWRTRRQSARRVSRNMLSLGLCYESLQVENHQSKQAHSKHEDAGRLRRRGDNAEIIRGVKGCVSISECVARNSKLINLIK